jgi:hypothetical protein
MPNKKAVSLPESELELIEFQSEMIEPTAAYLLGRWFHNCEVARKLKEKIEKRCEDENREPNFREHLDSEAFYDQCSHMWWGLQQLNSLSIVTRGAVHFNLAISNEMRRVSRYIEEHLGFDPILDKEKVKKLQFGDCRK